MICAPDQEISTVPACFFFLLAANSAARMDSFDSSFSGGLLRCRRVEYPEEQDGAEYPE